MGESLFTSYENSTHLVPPLPCSMCSCNTKQEILSVMKLWRQSQSHNQKFPKNAYGYHMTTQTQTQTEYTKINYIRHRTGKAAASPQCRMHWYIIHTLITAILCDAECTMCTNIYFKQEPYSVLTFVNMIPYIRTCSFSSVWNRLMNIIYGGLQRFRKETNARTASRITSKWVEASASTTANCKKWSDALSNSCSRIPISGLLLFGKV